MAFHRKVLLLLSVVLVCGSLGWTGIYGWHLRSDAFRREVEADLTQFFELPCDVGRIRGRTFSSRQFEDVDVWLPDRRDKIFHCGQAIWQEMQDGGASANELDIADGVLVLGTDRWLRADYRQVLESGLSHDFEELRLRRVGMERFEIAFDRGGLVVRCRETSGNIDMTKPKDGVANLTAYELNGHRVSQGVRIHARFTPGKTITVSEMVLSLPEVPLGIIAAEAPAFGRLQSGRFAGTVRYVGRQPDPEVWVSGNLDDAQLGELTANLPMGPFDGRVSVKLYEARLVQGVLTHLRGHGEVTELLLAPLAPLFKQPTLTGKAAIRVDAIDLSEGHVNHLALSGAVSDLSVEEWLRPLGHGSATGRLTVRINNVDLTDDQIKSADIELRLTPPVGGSGVIDRDLLLSAAEKALHFSWPSALPQDILPERVSYVECGVRLLVRDNQLRILGTHGKNSDTILTVKVLGAPFGIVKEQAGTIDLGPWVSQLRERMQSYSPEEVRRWLESAGRHD